MPPKNTSLILFMLFPSVSSQTCSVRFLNELTISGANATATLSFASGAVIDTQPSPGLGGYTTLPCNTTSVFVNWPSAAVRFSALLAAPMSIYLLQSVDLPFFSS